MRTLRLYDAERRGTWLDQLAPGEYPVFLRDATTSAERNAEGQPLVRGEASACLVFPTLEEARQYCEQKVKEMPELRCDVYDSTGLARPPLCTYGDREWNPKPKLLLWLGGGCIAASVPLFWMDWRSRGMLLLPSVIAINLVVAGLRFLFWGLGAIDAESERAKRAA